MTIYPEPSKTNRVTLSNKCGKWITSIVYGIKSTEDLKLIEKVCEGHNEDPTKWIVLSKVRM